MELSRSLLSNSVACTQIRHITIHNNIDAGNSPEIVNSFETNKVVYVCVDLK